MATINGTPTADNLVGTTGADSIYAFAGNDTISGLGGADLVRAGQGDDAIDETSSVNANSAVLYGDLGNDTILLAAESSGATIYGGQGADAITITRAFSSGLVQGDLGNDTIDLSAQILYSAFYGGLGSDSIKATLQGDSQALQFWGDATQDDSSTSVLVTLDDTITIDGGRHVLDRATVFAGAGNDLIDIYNTKDFAGAFVQGNKGDDLFNVDVRDGGKTDGTELRGGQGNDFVNVFSVRSDKTTVYGGQGDDLIQINARNNSFVSGGLGNDTISNVGAADKMTILGGSGADSISLRPLGSVFDVAESSIVGGAGDDAIVVDASVVKSTFFFGFGSGADVVQGILGASSVIAISSDYGSTGTLSTGGVLSLVGGSSITFDNAAATANITFIAVASSDITKLG